MTHPDHNPQQGMLRRVGRLVVLLAFLGSTILILGMVGEPRPDRTVKRAVLDVHYLTAQKQKRPGLSKAYLSLIAAHEGWTPDTLRRLGDLYQQQRNITAAAAAYERSLRGQPPEDADLPALRLLTEAALQRLDWMAAQSALQGIIRLVPTDQTAHLQLGLLLLPTSPTEGLRHMAQAAEGYPTLYTVIGATLVTYSDDPPPIKAYRLALVYLNTIPSSIDSLPFVEYALVTALNGEYNAPGVWAILGLVRARSGREGEALIRRALEAAPDDPTVSYAAGAYFRLRADYREALRLLLTAAALAPENPAIPAEIGALYRDQGLNAEAATWFANAAALAPDNPTYGALQATFYADANVDLTGEGLAALQRLSARFPTSADVLAALGWAYLSGGRHDEARLMLSQALAYEPGNSRAWFYYGVLLETLGEKGGAVEAYRVVVRAGGLFRENAARGIARLG
ncbi:MAG TPA: tetratricopeptide repeat protein [Aggregatilineales bacterium]|nr:tetratricopeptide repeat protein [Anaerolineales bacterium]HRE48200.1 tetratricopeptide repeat protein [Aggregatilineales bacterium]